MSTRDREASKHSFLGGPLDGEVIEHLMIPDIIETYRYATIDHTRRKGPNDGAVVVAVYRKKSFTEGMAVWEFTGYED